MPKKQRVDYDVDYWDKLSPDEARWLAQVIRETKGFPHGKGRERILGQDETRAAWREAKDRRRNPDFYASGGVRVSIEKVQHRLAAEDDDET